jgi:hypothetical protein
MSTEAIGFVILVFGGFALFGIVLGGVSWWSSGPGK